MARSVDANQSEISPLLAEHRAHAGNGIIVGETVDASNLHDSEDQPEVPIPEDFTTFQLILVMSGPWLGCFLGAMDSTIVATLSAPISTSFNSLSLLSWIGSAYLIANAVIQPISGRLTDIISRRNGLIYSNIFFALGNLICGLARTEWVMICGRVIAGIGGGGLTAIATFLASDLIPLRRRGLWQGFGNVVYSTGAGLGALSGGWINDLWNWRAAFFILVPLTIVSGSLVFFTIKEPVRKTENGSFEMIDFLGAFMLILSLTLLLLGVNSGGNIVLWTHPLVLTTIPLSLVFLGVFIYVEKTHAVEPIIPVQLMLDRTVFSACLTNWFDSMCFFSILFYGPIYFQVRGLSTTQAGVRLIPQSIGGGLSSVGSGLIMRLTGHYYLLSLGIQVTFVVSLIIASTFTLSTPDWAPALSLFLCGMGYAGMLTTTLLAFISAVEHSQQAVVTSASYAFRSTGSTLGIAIASAVFQNILDIKLQARLSHLPNAADVIAKLRNNLEEIHRVPRGWEGIVTGVYMEALRGVFLTTMGIGVLGLLVSLIMKEHVLHKNLARK
ncbi:hypothetical protein MMC07_002488 [Pseudocyphellaria aurata]|nr:hypothetical protein [Pseudocyphellaria aurata]